MMSTSMAAQVTRQANILSAFANRQGQLVFFHQHDGSAKSIVNLDFFDLRWCQSGRNQSLQRIAVLDNVDPLALKFFQKCP